MQYQNKIKYSLIIINKIKKLEKGFSEKFYLVHDINKDNNYTINQ